MLADGGFSGLRPQEKPAGPMEIPDSSVLVVRAAGAGLARSRIEVAGHRRRAAAASRRPRRQRRRMSPSSSSRSRKSGTVSVYGSGTLLLSWPFVVTPDHPPKIALTKEPERTPRGA